MSQNNGNNNQAFSFLIVGMFLIFLTLKLINYIDWSWWWVTAPLWLPTVIILAIALVIIFIAGIVKVFRSR